MEVSEVLVIWVGQLMLRREMSEMTVRALFQLVLTAVRRSLIDVEDWGRLRMWSRMLWRKKSFSGARGRGFIPRLAPMYQRSILVLADCLEDGFEPLVRKDDTSNTSSISLR